METNANSSESKPVPEACGIRHDPEGIVIRLRLVAEREREDDEWLSSLLLQAASLIESRH